MSVWGESEDGPMYAEEAVLLGSSATEDYDPDARYGFWVPPEDCSASFDENEDLQQSAWALIDTFDGAHLTVDVTFADDSVQSRTYALSTGQLKVVYNSDGTRDVLPQLAGDDEPFVYGVYVVDEDESRWLEWPVQDSRTISLSNPYGEQENGTFHGGVDIPADQGAVILAAADGTVTETGFDAERGNYLILDHGDGLTTLYGQCRDVSVEEGRHHPGGRDDRRCGRYRHGHRDPTFTLRSDRMATRKIPWPISTATFGIPCGWGEKQKSLRRSCHPDERK